MDETNALIPVAARELVRGEPLELHYGSDCKDCTAVPNKEYIYTWHSTPEQRKECAITAWNKFTHQGFFFWLVVFGLVGVVSAFFSWSLGPLYRAPVHAFVAFIVLYLFRGNLENKITWLGKFTMPGWAGHATFYLFHCPDCNGLDVDYVHGYRARLDCGCGARHYLRSSRFYTDDGREAPLRGLAKWRESYRIAEELEELWEQAEKARKEKGSPKE